MATTTKKSTRTNPYADRTCGECCWGEYIDKVRSRTRDGKPFLKKCGFATWGRHTSGERITLDSCRACEQFKEGTAL